MTSITPSMPSAASSSIPSLTSPVYSSANPLANGFDPAGKIFVVSGPPSSGKGTQCKLLAERFGMTHLSTGDIFRDHVARGTELGGQARHYLERGSFVPDELVISLVADTLRPGSTARTRGVLLDGFPRTADQAAALARIVSLERFVIFQVPDKTLLERAPDRRIDPETGDIYHLKYVKPPENQPEVAARLKCRDYDGDKKAFRVRLDTFHGQVRRVLPYFEPQKIVYIDAQRGVEEVHLSVIEALTLTESRPTTKENAHSSKLSPIVPICAVCLDKEANFLIVPCGHQCGCGACLNDVLNASGKCPICRTNITKLQRVFLAGAENDASGSSSESTIVGGPSLVGVSTLDDRLDAASSNPQATAKTAVPTLSLDDGWGEDAPEEADDEANHSAAAVGMPTSQDSVPSLDPRAAVSISVAPVVIPKGDDTIPVVVQVQVPEGDGVRKPTDIACVIDISGSMGSPATYEDAEGNEKDDGLTLLDIVKHAVKTVIKTLGPNDRLSIVSFNEKAEVDFPLRAMDEHGQSQAIEKLEQLMSYGRTNIWDGCHKGMESLRPGGPKSSLLLTGANVSPEAAAPDLGPLVSEEGRQRAMLLLTDGKPNISPPDKELRALQDYKDKYPEFSFQINTFGFGYNLDSNLLLDLALEGNGTYAFIPDAVIVGTTFVNCAANILSTLTQESKLYLTPSNGAELAGPCEGEYRVQEESWGQLVSLGPLRYGQCRDIVVRMRIPPPAAGTLELAKPYLKAVLAYPKDISLGSADCGNEFRATINAKRLAVTPEALLAHARNQLVVVGSSSLKEAAASRGNKAVRMLQTVVEELEKVAENAKLRQEQSRSHAGTNEVIVMSPTNNGQDLSAVAGELAALKNDATGRLSKAFQGSERFNRWGKHYVRALLRAHRLQICTNFMDPGLQVYGGETFRALREAGDAIFLALPPPHPSSASRSTTASNYNRNRNYTPGPAPDMTTYYAGSGGGCFGPSSTVQVFSSSVPHDSEGDGQRVRVCDVRAGDYVLGSKLTADENVHQIVCRVRCAARIARKPSPLICLTTESLTREELLTITPRHPVLIKGEWRLPVDIMAEMKEKGQDDLQRHTDDLSKWLYNFVLEEKGCTIRVGGVECVPWGHGVHGPVVGHPYYGVRSPSKKVNRLDAHNAVSCIVRDLEQLSATDGLITINGILRDSTTKRACGIY